MTVDERAREIYEQAPALTAFSRKPVDYALALELGMVSAHRARRLAEQERKDAEADQ